MRYIKFFGVLFGVVVFLALGLQNAAAQTATTGDLTGVVTDPTGAVMYNVKVQLKDQQKGITHETNTNEVGVFRFSLLPPGSYDISVNATGFQPTTRTTTVSNGQITTLDLKLVLGSTTANVVVIEEAPLVQTENGSLAATLDERTIQNMPNQGNDMSYPLEMTPGVTENTLGGYGNYSVNGMSGSSNLFTIDGMDDNDPYLSVNNTGATSLMLGQNEVQEATVVSNGYGGQFGGLAGSNVNFVTKSGSNQIHGRATYYWNGRYFNANSFLNNAHGASRGFANDNQWGGEVGGPILKNKVFWYFDTEGIRFILPPSSQPVQVPDPAFETAVVSNLMANPSTTASVPFYKNMFSLYDAARTAHNGAPTPGAPGCGTGAGAIPTATYSGNCVDTFQASSALFTKEAIYSWRIDYNLSTNDHIFGRYQFDRGFQGSYVDPISPLFNAVSPQPEYQGQIEESHSFGSTATNQFIMAGQWYTAPFNNVNPSATLAAFPGTGVVPAATSLSFNDGSFYPLGALQFILPQGRNVTQTQFSDDVSKTVRRHTLKFGVKYRRNDVTDGVYGENTGGTMTVQTIDAFFNGGFDPATPTTNFTNYSQFFPSSSSQRFKFWTVGGYAEDDIQVKSNLTISLALRADHESNPTCKDLCFSRLVEPFPQLLKDPVLGPNATYPGTSPAGPAPYSKLFNLNTRTALVGMTNIQWAPRFGFAWQPFGRDHNTVIRGGIGIFWDAFPGTVVDNISENPPLANTFTVGSGTAPLLISPAESSNVYKAAAASNNAFQSGFSAGDTLAQLQAAVPGFAAPAVNYTDAFTHLPQYQKWSLEVEQGFGANNSVTIAYNGNHGIHETVQNAGLNAFASPTLFPTGFGDLPTAPPDPRFNYARGIFTEGISNYEGLSISATHRYASGQIIANYTYSHALDEISNGGFNPFSYQSFFATNTSPIYQEDPYNLRSMYGSSDYDVRHYFSLTYLWELPFKKLTFGHGPDAALKGWQVSGTALVRSGLPWTPVDFTASGALTGGGNYGPGYGPSGPAPEVFANLTGAAPGTCSGPGSDVTKACFNTAAFAAVTNGYGTAGRNTMRGPAYFNSDFSVWKGIHVIPKRESAVLNIGFQFYNVFNHPNFDNPLANVDDARFGKLQRTLSPATTIYGVALGGDASPRLVQLKAQFQF